MHSVCVHIPRSPVIVCYRTCVKTPSTYCGIIMQDHSDSQNYNIATRTIHDVRTIRINGSAVMPIFQTATFTCDADDMKSSTGYGSVRYTRCNNNPSQECVAAKIASLHGAEAGLVTASGMSAIATTLMTFLSSGDHLLVQPCLYGGTMTLVHETLPKMGVRVTELDMNNTANWSTLVQHNTKVVYVETLSNPLCGVTDLTAVVNLARTHSLLAIIDNTFASPINLRPLELGFDIVLESATKYLNGHSDVIAGCVVGPQVLISKVLHQLNHMGGCLDPHACFLLQRGIKTLALRVERQNLNALALASALEVHPAVSKVHYPGLISHPQHDLAKRLFSGAGSGSSTWTTGNAASLAVGLVRSLSRTSSTGSGTRRLSSQLSVNAANMFHRDDHHQKQPGYGGVFAFELHGGLKAAETFLAGLRLATVAPSLGGVDTLVVLPSRTSHAGQSAESRAALGISDGLIRVAVGCEAPDDLIKDFLQALEAVVKAVE